MKTILARNARFLFYLILILIVRGTFADQNVVPSGSMEPTIHVGDHILVNKMAYDLRLPYIDVTLAHEHDPARGDIIVFFNPTSQIRMVKRLIGLPGDQIHIVDGFVTINGQPLGGAENAVHFAASTNDEWVYPERVGTHQALIRRTHSLLRPETLDVVVPQGEYFAMGDNRDNSYDSRGWGFIPRGNIQGKAVGVIYNLAWNPWPSVDWGRIAHALD